MRNVILRKGQGRWEAPKREHDVVITRSEFFRRVTKGCDE